MIFIGFLITWLATSGYVALLKETSHSILRGNSVPVLNWICQQWHQMGDDFLSDNDQESCHSRNRKIKVLNRNNKVHNAVSGVYLNVHDTLHSFVSSLLL